jgi:iron complex transport system ATP-binding protein
MFLQKERQEIDRVLVEVKNLSGGYSGGFFLSNINLKINKKDFVGIIGPNGSGKTTLIKFLTKIMKPSEGKIFIKGNSLEKIGYQELSRIIAVVSQGINFDFLNFTVEEFVLLGRIPHRKGFQFLYTKKDREVLENVMILTNILNLRERSLQKLCGGEIQRVLIAKALAQEPEILILDEPTTHLDIAYQVEILDLLTRLNKEKNLTILTILHDLNLASEYCEKLILLKEGKIYKIGTPEEILTYQIIEDVYKTIVIVEKNPISKKPYVYLVPEKERKIK